MSARTTRSPRERGSSEDRRVSGSHRSRVLARLVRGPLLLAAFQVAFARFEAGYAAALGLGMSFMSGLIVLSFLYLRRRGWEI